MILRLGTRMVTEVHPRLLTKFALNFGWRGMRAMNAFKARVRKGIYFPAVTFVSVTNRCNLSCQGCWVEQTSPPVDMPEEVLCNVIDECRREGAVFFGLLGGEPFLYPRLFDVIARYPSCYFQILTNGTVLTAEHAREMRRLGNVTPLISIEGMEQVSDERRGGAGVFQGALDGLAYCREQRLVTGVATSVCRSNFDDLVSRDFLHFLVDRGVHYMWYYIYRAVGPRPTPELALDGEQILALRRFIVEARCREPIAVLDAYWDHEGNALCPAAVGISHHVSPTGYIEPCPPLQFASDNIGDGSEFGRIVRESSFLERFRQFSRESTRGCVLMDCPGDLQTFVESAEADDTSGRACGTGELAAMCTCPGHHQPGQEIPEKHWLYRFAKKHWFFGFGAYG
ncbi:MAG: radical SAM protein [Lentisphaerae bacterium]|jgi:MoaA/NifB/PqqE/SkfB family radical SAM enzyme|nr:radical SAM protein [Lentisphaerota bacterium]MBT5606787.1 radical SAM protein [Lentisphaerota bacterium]MBT7061583.1 radical SAM protein [Lentisphaerota bacterium]MBT7843866.1 radical SAM protein [Lentisphaerota bacterium]